MFNWIRRRRLSPDARKRLLLVAARSEEAILETHVDNLLDLLVTLDDEVELDRGIEIYIEMMNLDESLATRVSTRVLARLEQPSRRDARPRKYRNAFRDGT